MTEEIARLRMLYEDHYCDEEDIDDIIFSAAVKAVETNGVWDKYPALIKNIVYFCDGTTMNIFI